MSNHVLKKIIQQCNSSPREKYNILTFPTHERYETQLCKTGHNFFFQYGWAKRMGLKTD